MKALISTAYGSPDVFQMKDIARPTPKDDEILVKIQTAGVGPSDCAFRKGDPFIIKLIYGLRAPKYAIGGVEFAGDVVAVGKAVTDWHVGDAIFGMSPHTFGTYAEYMAVKANVPLAHLSPNMPYADASAIADGAPTALSFLRDVAKLQAGQRVLINGASGSVGAYAVQLAKVFGAHVTGVCSGANAALVKSLGADTVIDYTAEDFTKTGGTYDVVFDAVGKSSFGRCKRLLTPQGMYLTTVPTLGMVAAVLRTALSRGKRARFTTAGLKQNRANLEFLRSLYDAGTLRAVIDRRYPLAQLPDAHRYVDTGRKKGNVVVLVGGA